MVVEVEKLDFRQILVSSARRDTVDWKELVEKHK